MPKLTPLTKSVTSIRNPGNRQGCWHRLSTLLLSLLCLTLAPRSQAVCQMDCLTGSNTAFGEDALISNTGFYNTAIGFDALFSNLMGQDNAALGFNALYSNTAGSSNVAIGEGALYSNTAGSVNTAIGTAALFGNTMGGANTAIGDSALFSNTHGTTNTAVGEFALLYNTTGNRNTASGVEALAENTTGEDNTAGGVSALLSNTTGNRNTAIGLNALLQNTTGSDNIAIGASAGRNLTSGRNNIDIGNTGARGGETGVLRLGTEGHQTATYIAGIQNIGLAIASSVGITADGQLGVKASSARYKEKIIPMAEKSEAILSLKPVSFRYKKEMDPKGIPQFGLVAEEVAKVDCDLVVPDANGKPLTVRYDEVNAMLLNEFLKEHKKVEKQETQLKNQNEELAELKTALKKLAARLDEKGL